MVIEFFVPYWIWMLTILILWLSNCHCSSENGNQSLILVYFVLIPGISVLQMIRKSNKVTYYLSDHVLLEMQNLSKSAQLEQSIIEQDLLSSLLFCWLRHIISKEISCTTKVFYFYFVFIFYLFRTFFPGPLYVWQIDLYIWLLLILLFKNKQK